MQAQRWWLRYALSLGVVSLAHLHYAGYFTHLPRLQSAIPSPQPALQQWLPQGQPALTWAEGYRGGRLVWQSASWGSDCRQQLQSWLAKVSSSDYEAVEVGAALQLYDLSDDRSRVRPAGALLACPGGPLVFSPSQLARSGSRPDEVLRSYQKQRGVLQSRGFRGLSWSLHRDQGWRARPLSVGQPLLPLQDVNRPALERACHNLAGFEQRMVERQHGLLPYRWSPAEGKSLEDGRILVRNALGSWSLSNYAHWTGKPGDAELARRHAHTMVGRYGHLYQGRAYLTDSDTCLLGSQALFALALHNLPAKDAELQRYEEQTGRAILESQAPDGSFRTSVGLPGSPPSKAPDPSKDGNQDFFPGETLTYFAQKWSEQPTGPWKDAFQRGFTFYRERFRRQPHPAAVPWLTQACVQRYRIDQDPAARELAFSALDWQLRSWRPFAELEEGLRGATVTRQARPHEVAASSGVGVQLEGLVEGCWLAREVGDRVRERRYQEAVREMSRYLMQMQYSTADSLYWLEPDLRTDCLGGIRDLPWDTRIQIDSCAHTLNAWINWLRLGIDP